MDEWNYAQNRISRVLINTIWQSSPLNLLYVFSCMMWLRYERTLISFVLFCGFCRMPPMVHFSWSTLVLISGVKSHMSLRYLLQIYCCAAFLHQNYLLILYQNFQVKNHFPFFDVAYQDFASGDLDIDAKAIRIFLEDGFFIATAISREMSVFTTKKLTFGNRRFS